MRKLQTIVLIVSMMIVTTGFASIIPAWDVGPPVTEHACLNADIDIVDLPSADLAVYQIAPESPDVGTEIYANESDEAYIKEVSITTKADSYKFIDRHRRLSIDILESDKNRYIHPPAAIQRE